MRKRVLSIFLAMCMVLTLLPATALAADTTAEDTGYKLTFTYPEELCTFTAEGDNNTFYSSGDTVPSGMRMIYEINNIAGGYRIKSVTMNGNDYTDGFVNGGYGGLATSIRGDTDINVELERIPDTLPSVISVTLYTDAKFTQAAAEYITYTADSTSERLYGKSTYSDGVEYPAYYATGQWEYSTDGSTWHPTVTWGGNRYDFWPGWAWHTELDFLTASYDIRLCVEPRELYTTGGNVYSNVVHINGGASGGGSGSTSGECGAEGDNLTWNLDADGLLTISGTGQMAGYEDSAPWDAFRETIRQVTIENGVTSIGGRAFSGCTSLTSVTIPDSVTSIGRSAFHGCTSLTDVYYGGSESQWEAISIGYYNDILLAAEIHYGRSMRVEGTLGDAAEVKWTYDSNTDRITVAGNAVNESEPIYVAVYDQDGRMTGLTAITASGGQASVGGDFGRVKLIWVDENTAPKCAYAEITENGNP